jgi:two-component system, NtrC family, sensor histidine kinase HydH
MAAPRPPPSPWPAFTQLLQRVAALEAEVARQHTTFAAMRDRQEALRQMMTELRLELAEVQPLDCETQRANQFALLGRLAGGLSHDLRNPLGAIFLHVEFLEEELQQFTADRAPQMAESLHDIKTHLMRLDDLLQDYLSLLQLERLDLSPNELGALVHTWAAAWQVLAEARGVRLEVKGLEQLGTVALHPGTLHRAVHNVVLNALDATPQGGTVTLVGQATATQVQLHVQDGGRGIAVAQLPRIFDPLYTTKPGGTGLGLYLVQQIVAAHNGQVGVQSVEGQGTTFTITWPRAAAE